MLYSEHDAGVIVFGVHDCVSCTFPFHLVKIGLPLFFTLFICFFLFNVHNVYKWYVFFRLAQDIEVNFRRVHENLRWDANCFLRCNGQNSSPPSAHYKVSLYAVRWKLFNIIKRVCCSFSCAVNIAHIVAKTLAKRGTYKKVSRTTQRSFSFDLKFRVFIEEMWEVPNKNSIPDLKCRIFLFFIMFLVTRGDHSSRKFNVR